MNNSNIRYRVVRNRRGKTTVLEESISAEDMSIKYRKSLCGCDPLENKYDKNDRAIREFTFYENRGFGRYTECGDPRIYMDGDDLPFIGEIQHVCPTHVECMRERSGYIDEYEEDYLLVS